MMPKWLTLAAGIALSACSSDGGSGKRGAAADECDTYVAKACQALAPCDNLEIAKCIAQVNKGIEQDFGENCSGADQVGASYQECLSDLEQVTCANPVVPASCSGVVLFE